MTFEELNRKLKWDRAFDKYFFSLSGIALSSFFIYILFFKEKNTFPLYGGITPIIIGIYTFYIAWKVDRFTIIENELTETDNTIILKNAILEFSNASMSKNYAIYTYWQKNIWKTPYEIYLYAGHNFIAVNAMMKHRRGIIDFGRSAAQRNKIIKLFEKHRVIYKSQKEQLILTAAH